MDVLKLFLRLPFILLALLWRLLSGLLRGLAWLLRPLLGEVNWRAPRWGTALGAGLNRVERGVERHPKAVAGGLLLLCAALAAGAYGWHRWQNRPQPIEAAPLTLQESRAEAINPQPVDFTEAKPAQQTLTLSFNRSVAPVTQAGKVVQQGISLKPALAGEWQWQNASTLLFTPKQPLPLGAEYQVTLQPDVLLAPQIRLQQTKYTFRVPGFDWQIASGEYYQNPEESSQHSAIFNLRFNAPADVQEVEKRLTLGLTSARGQSEQPLKFTLNWDEKKLNAWVRSQALQPMENGGVVHLQVGKGLKSSRPGTAAERKADGWVTVPGLYSLSISDVTAGVVGMPGGQSRHALTIGFSDAVRDQELSRAVQAWLLPQYDPRQPRGAEQEPAAWDLDNLEQAVLDQAEPLALTQNEAEERFQPQFSFTFNAPAQRWMLVEINPALTSSGGYKMAEKVWRVVQVPDYPQQLKFAAEGALLSVNGDKRISVAARNVPGLQMDIRRVIPSQLQHIVSFKSGEFASAAFNRLSEEYFTERFRYQSAIPDLPPGQVSYQGIDLGRYLSTNADAHRGIFLLTLSPWTPGQKAQSDDDEEDEQSDAPPVGDSRFVVVTDLGIIAKRSQDRSRELFVQSVSSGQPVEGATVKVVAKNGETLLKRTTGSDGHVSFPSLEVYGNERQPVMFLVEKAGDVSFLPTSSNSDRGLDFSRFDVWGDATPQDSRTLSSYLFSDRGVYRPGDTFHIGLITRAADWAVPVAGIPVRAEIHDPRDKLMRTVPLTLGASGFNELSFTTEESSPTGEWMIYLYLPGKNEDDTRLLGSVAVNVKAFEPDQLKVKLRLLPARQQGWVKPDQLQASIDVQNLFGTPAQGRRVTSRLTLRPVWPAFDRYPDFAFYEARTASDGYDTELEESTTGDDGTAAIKLDLSGFGQSTYQLQLLSEAFVAGGGRSVAATARTLVSPYDYLIGAKADGDLGWIRQNARRNLELIAVDPSLEKIAVSGLTLRLLQQKYLSVLTRQESGVYKYQSKLKEIPLSATPLDLSADGHSLALATEQPGDYVLAVENAKGEVLNRIAWSVAGQGNLTRSLDRNAELKLKLDKAEYQPGGEIEVAVNAPYTGSGLITIEKDRVWSWQWFHSDTTASVQKVRIPQGLEGNAYINVQFVRDINSDEIFMSPLSYGVMPFKISNAHRQNRFTLSSPPVIKPGQDLNIHVTTDGPQQVAVFAVDEGILQVARYRLTDPLDYFFRKRELSVESAQILDLILPSFSKLMALTSAPGGDGGEGMDLHLNPFKRKRDKPVAYWSGITEVNGQQQFSWPVPDYFNGKIRVMAIAVTADRIGKAQSATTVRDDVILTPNVPAMVAPGDEFDVSVGVSNNLEEQGGQPLPVSVGLTPAAQLTVVGQAEQSLSLAAKREGVVSFRLKVTGEPGDAPLRFTARYGDGSSSQRTVSTSVRPATPFRTRTVMGRMNGSEQQVGDLRQMFNAYAQREAAVSHSPLVLTRGLSGWLENYPYACSEQIVSQSVPLLMQSQQPTLRGAASDAKVRQQVKESMDVLRARQNAEGAVGLWRASPQADPFVTPYVVQYLLEAKAAGFTLPAGMLEEANAALRVLAASGSNDLDRLRLRSWAIWLLTRQGEVTTSALAAVQQALQQRYPQQWQTDLSALYLAATWKLLKSDDEANRLLQPTWQALGKAWDKRWWSNNYFDPLVQDATRLYLITRAFPERVAQIPPQVLDNMLQALREERYTTFSAAMSILALEGYAQQAGGAERLTVRQQAGSGQAAELISTINGQFAQGAFSPAATSLRFSNPDNAPAWYVVTQAGYDLHAPQQAIARGLEIARDYTDASGKPVNRVTVGQTLNVHLKIRANSDAALSNLAIVDLLPGGFEVVQQSAPASESDGESGEGSPEATAGWRSPLAANGSTWAPDFSDIREDRVIIYGSASNVLQEFIYQIRATNSGSFIIPPAFGEAMYNRDIQALSAGQGRLEVVAEAAAKTAP